MHETMEVTCIDRTARTEVNNTKKREEKKIEFNYVMPINIKNVDRRRVSATIAYLYLYFSLNSHKNKMKMKM